MSKADTGGRHAGRSAPTEAAPVHTRISCGFIFPLDNITPGQLPSHPAQEHLWLAPVVESSTSPPAFRSPAAAQARPGVSCLARRAGRQIKHSNLPAAHVPNAFETPAGPSRRNYPSHTPHADSDPAYTYASDHSSQRAQGVLVIRSSQARSQSLPGRRFPLLCRQPTVEVSPGAWGENYTPVPHHPLVESEAGAVRPGASSTTMRTQPLHAAVLANDLRLAKTLIRRGRADVDQQDRHGATPLMLAALTGSPAMVAYLLEKGVAWDVRDGSGATVAQYTQVSFAETLGTRYKRPTSRKPSTSAAQRARIGRYLLYPDAVRTQYRTKRSGTVFFYRAGRSLRVFKLIATVRLGRRINRGSTAGYIACGNSLKPVMCAVSGWTADRSAGLLDGSEYTAIVREMAAILDFDLGGACNDTPGGKNKAEDYGRANACHCEKMLAAFWVVEQIRFAFGTTDLTRMADLKSADLPSHRREAVIYLDKRPCMSCRTFLGCIQHGSGLRICVFPQKSVRETPRAKRAVASAGSGRRHG